MLSLIAMMLIGNMQRAVYVVAVALVVAVVALVLAISAMRAAKRAGTRRPRAALAGVVLGVAGALFSALRAARAPDLLVAVHQYANCMNGATTVAAQNACQNQLKNSIGNRITLLGDC